MSIADQIIRLNEIKEAISGALISKGQTVTDADSFYSYADKVTNISSVSNTVLTGDFTGVVNKVKYDLQGTSTEGISLSKQDITGNNGLKILPGTYTAVADPEFGYRLSISPSSFTIENGQTLALSGVCEEITIDDECLNFTATEDGTEISINKIGNPYDVEIYYMVSGATLQDWTAYTVFGQTITINEGETIYCKNLKHQLSKDCDWLFETNNAYYRFSISKPVYCNGSITSMLGSEKGTYPWCYWGLFRTSNVLTSKQLLTPPKLDIDSITTGCLFEFFSSNTNLQYAPVLSSESLAPWCYAYMFIYCSSLIEAPSLPAAELTGLCYANMFNGCSSLSSVSVAFTDWLSGDECTGNWLSNVAASGEFYCPSALGTNETIERGDSYCPSGWQVINLEECLTMTVSGCADADANGNYDLISGTACMMNAVYENDNGYTFKYDYDRWALKADDDTLIEAYPTTRWKIWSLPWTAFTMQRYVEPPAPTGQSIVVSGAGTTAVNGTYALESGTHGTLNAVYRKDENTWIAYDSLGEFWVIYYNSISSSNKGIYIGPMTDVTGEYEPFGEGESPNAIVSNESQTTTKSVIVSGAGRTAANGTYTLVSGTHLQNDAFYKMNAYHIAYSNMYLFWGLYDENGDVIMPIYTSNGDTLIGVWSALVTDDADIPSPTVSEGGSPAGTTGTLRITNTGYHTGTVSIDGGANQDLIPHQPAEFTLEAGTHSLVYGGNSVIEPATATVTIVAGQVTETSVFMSCFIAGTKIALADGTEKNVEDITYEDDLLVWNFDEGCLDSAKPAWIKKEETANEWLKTTYSNGTVLGTVGTGLHHEAFSIEKSCFDYIDKNIGNTAFAIDGEVKQMSSEIIKENIKYYNLITKKHFNCFANGILTSCRLNNMYAIANMKYVKDGRKTDTSRFEGIPSQIIDDLRLAENKDVSKEYVENMIANMK